MGPQFPDMSEAYDPELRHLALAAAAEAGFEVVEGVYAAVLGPSFETPAEVHMLHRLGASVVGMSTVPEVIAARHMGVKVLDHVAGLEPGRRPDDRPLTHEEVLEDGRAPPTASPACSGCSSDVSSRERDPRVADSSTSSRPDRSRPTAC